MQIDADSGGGINPELIYQPRGELDRVQPAGAGGGAGPGIRCWNGSSLRRSFIQPGRVFHGAGVGGEGTDRPRGKRRTPNGFTPSEQYAAIRAALLPLVLECQEVVCDELLPALAAQGIVVAHYVDLERRAATVAGRLLFARIFPVLTPLVVDPTHRFPFISNLSRAWRWSWTCRTRTRFAGSRCRRCCRGRSCCRSRQQRVRAGQRRVVGSPAVPAWAARRRWCGWRT